MATGQMKMNEAEVNQMIDMLRQSANKLRELTNTMTGIAKVIDDGALQGAAGDAFAKSINTSLNGSIERLAVKLEERARYVEKERDELKRAMSESGALYTGG